MKYAKHRESFLHYFKNKRQKNTSFPFFSYSEVSIEINSPIYNIIL